MVHCVYYVISEKYLHGFGPKRRPKVFSLQIPNFVVKNQSLKFVKEFKSSGNLINDTQR